MLDNTIGATLVGVILTTFTYGIATIQVYRYWNTYRDDSRYTRLYVLLLWLLDTSKVASICHIQYYYTITNYGNAQALLSTTWSLSFALCMTGITTFMVQSFLARRTWNFARRVRSTRISRQAIQALGALIATISLTQLAFGLVSTVTAWKVRYFTNVVQYRWLGISWLGSAAVCDILLVCSLTTVLVMQRTGFKRTDMLVNRIILYTINTGLLTSLVAITDLILFCSMSNFVHLIPNFLLGTLYIITLLATLHTGETGSSPHSAESGIASRSNTKWSDPGDIPFPRGTLANTQNPATFGFQMPEIVRVQVNQETCIQGVRSYDGASQRSVDQDDTKCYDAKGIPHTLV